MNLADCFASCFDLVDALLHGDAAAYPDPRGAAAKCVDSGVVKASAEFTPLVLLRARRLMSVWIDNRLGSADWPGRAAWRDDPLLPGGGEGCETYLLELAGHLDSGSDEDGQLAFLMLECLGKGFALDEACCNGLLGLLAERFKPEA